LGKLDQVLGFIFGVLRGIALIAIAFFAYNAVLSSQSLPLVDESRSAKVFGDMAAQIEARNPERALGWVTVQYEQLVSVCNVE
jgi:membrane protein required for colicin V production